MVGVRDAFLRSRESMVAGARGLTGPRGAPPLPVQSFGLGPYSDELRRWQYLGQAKLRERDPLSGEDVRRLLYVKGSGGDLGSMGLGRLRHALPR